MLPSSEWNPSWVKFPKMLFVVNRWYKHLPPHANLQAQTSLQDVVLHPLCCNARNPLLVQLVRIIILFPVVCSCHISLPLFSPCSCSIAHAEGTITVAQGSTSLGSRSDLRGFSSTNLRPSTPAAAAAARGAARRQI